MRVTASENNRLSTLESDCMSEKDGLRAEYLSVLKISPFARSGKRHKNNAMGDYQLMFLE